MPVVLAAFAYPVAVQAGSAIAGRIDGQRTRRSSGAGGIPHVRPLTLTTRVAPAGGEEAGTSEEASDASATRYGLEDTFDETRSGARLRLRYTAGTRTVVGTATNTTQEILRRVRIAVHLSNGVELGPLPTFDLAPGAIAAIYLPADYLPADDAPFQTWTAHVEAS